MEGLQQPNSDAQKFPCAQCGAPEMHFDAPSQQMLCQYCGHRAAVPQHSAQQMQQAVVEQDLETGMAQAARGLGVETRSIKCNTCGATVSFTGQSTSQACDFCGSPHVLEQESNRNLIRPASLVPFQLESNAAQQKFKDWLGGLWFRPGDLKSRASVGAINGVYVPYWTFDAWVSSSWSAESGTYYYVDETYTDANGKKATRKARKTKWSPAHGQRQDHYDDVLVPASRGLPEGIAEEMKTFDTSRLVPYESSYLAGWRAEEYGVEIAPAWTKASQIMANAQRSKCAGDVPGDTHRNLDVNNAYSNKTFKHVLLPLFIASYMYNQKTYRFLVNGQTGEVRGKAPYSVIKIVLFVLMILAIIGTIVGVVTMLNAS